MKNDRRTLFLMVFGMLVVGLVPMQKALSAPWDSSKTSEILAPIKTQATQIVKEPFFPRILPLPNWQPVQCNDPFIDSVGFIDSPNGGSDKWLHISMNDPLGRGICGARINLEP